MSRSFSIWDKNTWEPWHIYNAIQSGDISLPEFLEWYEAKQRELKTKKEPT